MDEIQAPWIGDPDYGESDFISDYDREYELQDDMRKDAQIQEDLQNLNKK